MRATRNRVTSRAFTEPRPLGADQRAGRALEADRAADAGFGGRGGHALWYQVVPSLM